MQINAINIINEMAITISPAIVNSLNIEFFKKPRFMPLNKLT